MRWVDSIPDLQVADLSSGLSHLDCFSVLCAAADLSVGANLFIATSCFDSVQNHVRSDTKEVGGLLLGHVLYSVTLHTSSRIIISIVTRSLPSQLPKNSHTSLRMDTEVWNQASEFFPQGEIVIGWYHSHPNLGAFFSGTDRKTQRSFFYHDYSIGWVIDPFKNSQMILVGYDSKEYPLGFLVVPNSFIQIRSGFPKK